MSCSDLAMFPVQISYESINCPFTWMVQGRLYCLIYSPLNILNLPSINAQKLVVLFISIAHLLKCCKRYMKCSLYFYIMFAAKRDKSWSIQSFKCLQYKSTGST